jgi:transcription antitermination factor NusG
MWYALRVRSNFEQRVSTALRGRGFEEFLPQYRSRRAWSDRIKEISLPLFPGYIFCRLNPLYRLPILQTAGVIEIVGVGGQPYPVAEGEMAAIRRVLAGGVSVSPWPFVRAGQRVEIHQGPLAGLEGILTSVKNEQLLLLSVDLLQRSVAVSIESAWVRPLPSSARN